MQNNHPKKSSLLLQCPKFAWMQRIFARCAKLVYKINNMQLGQQERAGKAVAMLCNALHSIHMWTYSWQRWVEESGVQGELQQVVGPAWGRPGGQVNAGCAAEGPPGR